MIGSRVAHYEVIARIGAGGMGEVYRARDLRLEREVAIKFLPSALPSSEERERLKREARTLATLNHPNIVTVYSVEEDAGTHFVTMELLEGETLAAIIAKGGLRKEHFLDLALQLLEAIRVAHRQGVVHRDLKPANIMICSDQRLKVLDFGIAKIQLGGSSTPGSSAEQQDFTTQLLTQPGLVMGTISYFSPEQAQGQKVDGRSDIFSLGIILYQMCTGRHPFPGDNAAMIISSILRDAPAPIDDFEEPWRRRLRPVIERCLEKNPERRYQRVSDLVDDLIALQTEPHASLRISSVGRQGSSGRESLGRLAQARAAQASLQLEAEAELSPDDLEQLAEAAWWNGRMDECCQLLERAYADYLREKQPKRAALMSLKLADVFYHRASPSVSTGWLRQAQRLLENAVDTVEYGYLLRFQTVVALEVDGDAESALRLAKQSFDIANRVEDKDLLALSTQDQGRVLVDQGQLSEGMALLDEAMATVLSGEVNPLTVARTYCNMIATCERTADYRRASEWTEQARQWGEPRSGSPFPGICSVHRAEIFRLRGALNQAEQECRQVCADSRGYVDTAAAAFYEIGEIRLRRGDYDKAEEAFRDAHERGRDPVPGLPLLLLAQGKADAARSMISRALAGSVLPLDRARLLPTQIRIALACGDLDGVKPSIEELESIASHYGSTALQAAAAHARESLDLAHGDFENSSKSLRRALELWLKADLPYEAATTRTLLAQSYRGQGDEASADLELRSARSAFEKLGAQASVPDFDTMIGGA
jgi:serine/threonine protein kinase